MKFNFGFLEPKFVRFGGREFFSVSEFSNVKAAEIKGVAAKMKLNVIFAFRTINSVKLQGVHFYIIDINFRGTKRLKYISPKRTLVIEFFKIK